MTSTSNEGFLARAARLRQAKLVGINKVDFVVFGRPVPGIPTIIGTKGLSACTVVAVVSERGAILAHIGPNILGSEDPESFIKLAYDQMDDLESLFNEHRRDLFGQGNNAYVIFAASRGNATSPEQVAIFRDRLQKMGLPIVGDRPYTLSPQGSINDNSRFGTVWVAKNQYQPAAVFLEDQCITPTGLQTQPPDSSHAGSSHAGPSYAGSLHAGSSHAGSSHSESSRAASQGNVLQGTWTMVKGEDEYKLRDNKRNVLHSTRVPPPNVWIYFYDNKGKLVATKFFDGTQWRTGQIQ